MFFSRESTRVSTVIIAKMPTVTPRRDSIVRRRLYLSAFQAKRKLSKIWVSVFIQGRYGYSALWLVVFAGSKLLKGRKKHRLCKFEIRSPMFANVKYCRIFATLFQ